MGYRSFLMDAIQIAIKCIEFIVYTKMHLYIHMITIVDYKLHNAMIFLQIVSIQQSPKLRSTNY